MSQLKHGIYVQETSEALKEFIRAVCPRDGSPWLIVTLAYDYEFWRDIRAEFPNIILLVRWWVDTTEQQVKLANDPIGAADEMADHVLSIPIVRDRIATHTMDYNEHTVYGNRAIWPNIDTFQARFYDRVHSVVEPVAFNTPTGNLDGPDYLLFPKTLARYKWYAVHGYGWPTMMNDFKYGVGRILEIMPAIQSKVPDAKFLLTETGITQLLVAGGRDIGFWKAYPSDADVHFWHDSLEPSNKIFLLHPALVGTAVFMCGVADHGDHADGHNWDDFDILPSGYIRDRMAELSRLPNITIPQPEEKPMHYAKGRTHEIDTIVVHHTGITSQGVPTPEQAIQWMKENGTSAHGVIGWDGRYVEMVADEDTAFGASGTDADGNNISDWNDRSIHFELCGDGNKHKFSDAQYNTLAVKASEKRQKHPIKQILGHSEITPGKVDPGELFEWGRLHTMLDLTGQAEPVPDNWKQYGQTWPEVASNLLGVAQLNDRTLKLVKARIADLNKELEAY